MINFFLQKTRVICFKLVLFRLYITYIYLHKKKYIETGETVHRNSGNCEKHGHDMMYNRTCTFTYYYNYLFRLRAKAEDDMAWPLRYLLTSKSFLLSAVILFLEKKTQVKQNKESHDCTIIRRQIFYSLDNAD